MEYVKIKVELKEYPKRLNRTLYVRKNISLLELGCVIVNSVYGTYEHFFMFETPDQTHFVPASFMDWEIDGMKQYPLVRYLMKELGSHFTFTYDNGDNYEFNVRVLKGTKEVEPCDDEYPPLAYFVSGKGLGIWEDNISGMVDYFEGIIGPDEEENEEKYIVLPWNLGMMERFGDYDEPLDKEEIQFELDQAVFTVDTLLDEEEGYFN